MSLREDSLNVGDSSGVSAEEEEGDDGVSMFSL